MKRINYAGEIYNRYISFKTSLCTLWYYSMVIIYVSIEVIVIIIIIIINIIISIIFIMLINYCLLFY